LYHYTRRNERFQQNSMGKAVMSIGIGLLYVFVHPKLNSFLNNNTIPPLLAIFWAIISPILYISFWAFLTEAFAKLALMEWQNQKNR
jgi:hypothetical protein